MANTPFNGSAVGLYLKKTDDIAGEYQLLVCSTDLGLSQTANEIDASSKCGPYTLAGIKEGEITVTAQMLVDAATTGTIGVKEVREGFSDNVSWDFKITDNPTAPTIEDVSGQVIITSMDFNWSNDEAASADITFKTQGSITYGV